jgi:hypothetical protein
MGTAVHRLGAGSYLIMMWVCETCECEILREAAAPTYLS